MVSGASAALDSSSDLPLGLKSPSRFHLMKNSPMIEIAANGTSFVYVVACAKMPASFTPRRFSIVTSQIAPSVTATPTGRLPCNAGSSFRSEPVKATAITGSDAQIEIQ